MKRELLTTPNHFPVVDDRMARDVEASLYHWGDVVGMLAPRGHPGKHLPGPDALLGDCQKIVLRRVPLCDIGPGSVRVSLADPREREVQSLPWLGLSTVAHAAAVGVFGLLQYLGVGTTRLPETEMIPVELAFGVGTDFRATAPSQQNPGKSEADVEATKLKETLPQLPKTLAMEGAEKAPDTMPVPAVPTPVPTRRVEVESTPEPGTKTLKAEEIVKRLEKESRKVGKEERPGTHVAPGDGAKNPANDLPVDPFASQGTSASLPAGDPGGRLSPSARTYKEAATAALRRQWSLPDVVNFDPALVTRIEVDVSMFGKVLSVKVVQGSGDRTFDDHVIETVESAKLPDFSTDGVPKRTLVLDFRPRDVK